MNYVIVETLKDVAEFLDHLAEHDLGFQKAIEDNRGRRAALLNAAKSRPTTTKPALAKAPTKAVRAKPLARANKPKTDK
ncbi:hypothetical protein [Rhizobium miluonense]|uniref:hypothetical protein n=1 Tax=Rhizobium miluonense TaxID=411945 RepID=UPI001FD9945B|nr:hypothetical protein [Rhizobium miluonense]